MALVPKYDRLLGTLRESDPGPAGADGVVQSIVAGTNVTVDSTDPANPVVSASGTGGSSAWGGITGTLSDQTDLQDELDGKSDTGHTHLLADVTDVTASVSEVNVLDGITAATAELNYTDGVTSNIQTQLDAKEDDLTFSTGLTRSTDTVTSDLSTGKSGGQSVIGGTASGDDLTLSSTSNGTKGEIVMGNSRYDEASNYMVINASTGYSPLDVGGVSSAMPSALPNAVARMGVNANQVNGVYYRNANAGTSADFRFMVGDDANDSYIFMGNSSTTNTTNLFGIARNTLSVIAASATTTPRHLLIGTIAAKDVIIATNNSQAARFTSDNLFGVNTTPTNYLTVRGATPASVATSTGTASTGLVSIQTATGGNTTIATTGTGGVGGAISMIGGIGGQATAALTLATGGAGGALSFTGGTGRDPGVTGGTDATGGAGGRADLVAGSAGPSAGVNSGTNRGGVGGGAALNGGDGGAASNGGTNIGGVGGAITSAGGNGGASAAGTGGNGGAVSFRGGTAGTGSTPGTGGSGTFAGGPGGASAGSGGGAASLNGGAGTATGSGGAGGQATINGGAANGDNTVNRAGGPVIITAGVSKGSTVGGAITVNAGAGGLGTATTGANGGAITLTAGAGGANTTGGVGGAITLAGGLQGAGGTAGGGAILFRVAATTTLATAWTIANTAALTAAEASNMIFGTTTGTKIGTATSQKIGFWNATPIVQPTTAVAAATFVANTSGTLNDTATFDGYTIGQVVKALRNIGALA